MQDPTVSAETVFNTFESVFGAGSRSVVIPVLATLIKQARKEGMERASEIAASHNVEEEEIDAICRAIAREIRGESGEI